MPPVESRGLRPDSEKPSQVPEAFNPRVSFIIVSLRNPWMTLARGTESIESERLILHRIELADFELFSRIHADPEVARYVGLGRPGIPEESLGWIRATVATYENVSLGSWPCCANPIGCWSAAAA
jgi:RimJ/RimL family protein N-acetyltransferase